MADPRPQSQHSDRCSTCGVSKQQVLGEHDKVRIENARLRELYVNAVDIEKRGWTIDHLLECDEAWRDAEVRVATAEAVVESLRAALDELLSAIPIAYTVNPTLQGAYARANDVLMTATAKTGTETQP